MFQIKHWVFYPNPKHSVEHQRTALDKFFSDINKFLETRIVSGDNIIVSDSSDYIFVYIVYKVLKPKESK